jgi:hypothetical protein
MTISLNFISGFMLGFEIVDGKELDEEGTFLVIDLFIVRFLVEW